jgi:hypothetical protein
VILVIIIVLQRECNKPEPCPPMPADTVNIIIPPDPEIIIKPVPKPYPVYRDTGSVRWKYKKIDSLEIVKLYFAQNKYHRILKDDTSAFVAITDVVTENELQEAIFEFQNRRPIMVQEINILPPSKAKNKYFVGLGIGRSPTEFGLAPSVALLTKKDHLYTTHYDVLNKDLYFTMYWNIRWAK